MNEAAPPAIEPRETAFTPAGEPPSPPLQAASLSPPAPASASTPATTRRWLAASLILLLLLAGVALWTAWRAEQRVRGSERELVRRQQESAQLVSGATLLAKQAQESSRDAVAKVALLEARLSEVAVQRSQLEELVQSVARSRDETLLADIEAALRGALQQAALSGSVEPLVAELKQADERLNRANQPRLEPVRRSIARDLERLTSTSVADVASLSLKLDEAVRLVDEMPMISAAEPRRDFGRGAAPAPAAAGGPDPAASAAPIDAGAWVAREFGDAARRVADSVWSEIRSLVRVTRIDHPEAMLVAPDQAFFLRENLKLRLLNARLALLSRQFDTAQGDLRWVQAALERYFERSSRHTQAVVDLVRQVAVQARVSGPVRPDDTLAALAAVSGPR